MKMRIDNPFPSVERAAELKKAGESAMWYGRRAADMTKDELLIFIGMMCETHVFQGGQLAQAAKNIQSLTDALQQSRCHYSGCDNPLQWIDGFCDEHSALAASCRSTTTP